MYNKYYCLDGCDCLVRWKLTNRPQDHVASTCRYIQLYQDALYNIPEVRNLHMTQAVNRQFHTAETRVQSQNCMCVRFMADEVALGFVFLRVLLFLPSSIISSISLVIHVLYTTPEDGTFVTIKMCVCFRLKKLCLGRFNHKGIQNVQVHIVIICGVHLIRICTLVCGIRIL